MAQMNNIMVERLRVLTYVDFLLCTGLWFMMATIEGFQRRYFWINSTIDTSEMAPYRSNDILPQTCFESIIKELTINDKPPP